MSDKYKTYEELKEELGNNYDLYMYEINLCLLQKIDKAIEYIKEHTDKLKTTRVPKIDFDYSELLEILGDKENE